MKATNEHGLRANSAVIARVVLVGHVGSDCVLERQLRAAIALAEDGPQ